MKLKFSIVIFACLFGGATVRAQSATALPISQIKGPPATICVLVFMNGTSACATLDPSVTIVIQGAGPVIRAASASSSQSVYGESYTAAVGQTAFALSHTPVAGSVRVFLNGLRMLSPGDFTISQSAALVATVTIPNAQPGGLVAFDYNF